MRELYVIVANSNRNGIDGIDWVKDGEPVSIYGEHFVKETIVEAVRPFVARYDIHLCAVGNISCSTTLVNLLCEKGCRKFDGRQVSFDRGVKVIPEDYCGREEELFKKISDVDAKCMLFILGEPALFDHTWLKEEYASEVDCSVMMLSFKKREWVELTLKKFINDSKTDAKVYGIKADWRDISIMVVPNKYCKVESIQVDRQMNEIVDFAWSELEKEGIVEKFKLSRENTILERDCENFPNNLMFRISRLCDFKSRGDVTRVLLANTYIGNGTKWLAVGNSAIKDISRLLERGPIELIVQNGKDIESYSDLIARASAYNLESLNREEAIVFKIVEDLDSAEFKQYLSEESSIIVLADGAERIVLEPVMSVLQKLCPDSTFWKFIDNEVQCTKVADWASVCKAVKIHVISVVFDRTPENKNEKTFDFVRVSVNPFLGSSKTYVKEVFLAYKKEIIKEVIEALKQSSKFQRYGVPVDFIKPEAVTIRNGGTILVTFGLKSAEVV